MRIVLAHHLSTNNADLVPYYISEKRVEFMRSFNQSNQGKKLTIHINICFVDNLLFDSVFFFINTEAVGNSNLTTYFSN